MKKLLLILVLGIITNLVYSQTSFVVDGINYTTSSDSTVAVTSGGNYTGIITIPSSITYSAVTYSVTSISDRAFESCREKNNN